MDIERLLRDICIPSLTESPSTQDGHDAGLIK